MNCIETQNMLARFLNGELSGDKARLIRQHLASCSKCRSGLTATDKIEFLPALDDFVAPSEDFALHFHARLEQLRRRPAMQRRDRGWRRSIAAWGWPKQLATVGALALVIAAGIYLRRPSTIEPGPYVPENELRIAEKLPLLEDMAVISNLDLLEDFKTIENLPDQ